MTNWKDLTNKKFNRLTPIKYIGKSKWLCKCDCGKEVIVSTQNIKNGHTKSCGCLKIEQNKKNLHPYKHNLVNTRLYRVFAGMKQRCYRKTNYNYKWYGGKGIKICDEWLKDFKNFYNWAINNGYDESLPWYKNSIDRIDSNKDYSPENCRWITMKEQRKNQIKR